MTEKRVWLFKEGNADMRALLGGKGANLAEMTNLGLPVPPGLTITTETCMDYINNGNKMPAGLMDEVKEKLKTVEQQAGKKFGDSTNPLLVSVRSGARVSMPGMMETILNLGLNDETVEAMVKLTNNPRFCYDSYRRFLTMFGSVAWEMDRQKYFESEVEKVKAREGVSEDTQISAEGWKSLIPVYKQKIKEVTGKEFPQDPYVQLQEAIEAVFRSWNIPRAVAYRNMNKIDHNFGTAVNVRNAKKITDVPVIGITKPEKIPKNYKELVYITPSVSDAERIIDAGADIVAFDATFRNRPVKENVLQIINCIHSAGRLAMADISTFEEGVMNALLGADIISTTLSGYTTYSDKGLNTPDFELVKKLSAAIDVPVILEGRIWEPDEVNKAFDNGAFSVVIGSAVTRPQLITRRFVKTLE